MQRSADMIGACERLRLAAAIKGDETMNATKTLSVWDVKKMQDRLFDEIIQPLQDAGLHAEACAILNAFDAVIDQAAE
jgi:ribonuclease HIII